MKKATFTLAAVCFAVYAVALSAFGANQVRDVAVAVTANVGTNFQNTVVADGTPGGVNSYGYVDKVVFYNACSVTGWVDTAVEDLSGLTVVASTPIAAGGYATAYPRRSITETWAGYVVTGNVQVASTSTTTKTERYAAQKLRFTVSLAASNSVAASVTARAYFDRD